MHSGLKENIMEHSHHTAVIAHSLALINNKVYGGTADPEKTVMIALYHEISEVITGDMPSPIKYFNQNIKKAYKDLEQFANDKLINMLPDSFRNEYRKYIEPDAESIEYKLCKGADKLAAYIKCIEEIKSGNKEFVKAEASIKKIIQNMGLKEAKYFLDNFIQSYQKTLDELE